MRIVITGEGRIAKEFARFARTQPDTEITIVTHRDCEDGNVPDCDILIHAGARVFAEQSIAKPEPYIRDNVNGTYAMLEFARRRRVKRFVYISTTEAADIKTPYAATKAAGELLTQAWGASYGLSYLIIRLPNVFIPDYSDKGIVGRLLRCEITLTHPNRLRKWIDGPAFAEELWNLIQSPPNRLVTIEGRYQTDEQISEWVDAWKHQIGM